MKNKFKLIDESGDKRYFTIIPNYIVNHSTVYEQAIYLYMKRIAGETGTCWSSAQIIAQKLGCSRNTIAKYKSKLVKRGWIKTVGKRGKTRPTDEYRVVDLWQINNKFYALKDSSNSEQSQKIVQPVNLDSSTVVHKEEHIKKNTILSTYVDSNRNPGNTPKRNKDIDDLTTLLKETFGLSILDGSEKMNRRFCWLALKKFRREGIEDIIKAATQDKFWSTKITNFRDLYYNGVKIASTRRIPNVVKV